MYLLGKQNFGLLLFDRIQRLLVEVEPPAGPGFPAGPLAGPLTGPLAGHLAGPLDGLKLILAEKVILHCKWGIRKRF